MIITIEKTAVNPHGPDVNKNTPHWFVSMYWMELFTVRRSAHYFKKRDN